MAGAILKIERQRQSTCDARFGLGLDVTAEVLQGVGIELMVKCSRTPAITAYYMYRDA
jgi:hypothetical protein